MCPRNFLSVLLMLSLLICNSPVPSLCSEYTVTILSGDAGNPTSKDGPFADARFWNPVAIAYDPTKPRMFVAETGNHLIRMLDLQSGNVSTICGGAANDGDGLCIETRFSTPAGLAVSPDGKFLFVSDSGSHKIRRIKISDNPASFEIQTIGGTGQPGYYESDSENTTGPSEFHTPKGLAFVNNTLLVADSGNHCIRSLSPPPDTETGPWRTTPIAGQCTHNGNSDNQNPLALFSDPFGIANLKDDQFVVLEKGSHKLRVVNSTHVSSLNVLVSGIANSDVLLGLASIDDRLVLTCEGKVLLTQGIQTWGELVATMIINDGTGNFLRTPYGVCASNGGLIFIADLQNQQIVRVDTPPRLIVQEHSTCGTTITQFTLSGSNFCPKQCGCHNITITASGSSQNLDCRPDTCSELDVVCNTVPISISTETAFNATLRIPTTSCAMCPHVGNTQSVQVARAIPPPLVTESNTTVTLRPETLTLNGLFSMSSNPADFAIKLANERLTYYNLTAIQCAPKAIFRDTIDCTMRFSDEKDTLEPGPLLAKVYFKGCSNSQLTKIANVVPEDSNLLQTVGAVLGVTGLGFFLLIVLIFLIVAVGILIGIISLKVLRSKPKTQDVTNTDDTGKQIRLDGIVVESDDLNRMGEVVSARITVDTSRYLINMKDLKITQKIGVGAYGVVYKGSWKHETVAIKKFRDAGMYDSEEEVEKIVRDFAQECSILAQLRHPNIVNFFGATLKFPDLAMVLEFADKGSLHDLLYRQKTKEHLTWAQRLRILFDVAKGMEYLHSQQLLHRDLKSQNILITSGYNAKVSDFGMSKFRDSQDRHSLTAAVGSLLWMAPEVALGEHYSLPVDVFSFAIIISEMLTDRLPYSDLPPQNQNQVHVKVATDNTEKLRPTIPPIQDVFERMCSMQSESTLSEPVREKIHQGVEVADEVMRNCWRRDPELRLTFDAVVIKLSVLFQEDTTPQEEC